MAREGLPARSAAGCREEVESNRIAGEVLRTREGGGKATGLGVCKIFPTDMKNHLLLNSIKIV